jgi:5-methylcytosine-specific restriction endonuclease McrA
MGDGQTSRYYRKARKQFLAQCAEDQRPCWLCGQPINYALPRQDPYTGTVNDDAPEVDHIYPRSKYPELAEDPGGFRPSHRSRPVTGSGQTRCP